MPTSTFFRFPVPVGAPFPVGFRGGAMSCSPACVALRSRGSAAARGGRHGTEAAPRRGFQFHGILKRLVLLGDMADLRRSKERRPLTFRSNSRVGFPALPPSDTGGRTNRLATEGRAIRVGARHLASAACFRMRQPKRPPPPLGSATGRTGPWQSFTSLSRTKAPKRLIQSAWTPNVPMRPVRKRKVMTCDMPGKPVAKEIGTSSQVFPVKLRAHDFRRLHGSGRRIRRASGRLAGGAHDGRPCRKAVGLSAPNAGPFLSVPGNSALALLPAQGRLKIRPAGASSCRTNALACNSPPATRTDPGTPDGPADAAARKATRSRDGLPSPRTGAR